jgi:hypothetical protein
MTIDQILEAEQNGVTCDTRPMKEATDGEA